MKSRTIGLSWFVPSRRAQAAFTYFDFKVYQNLTGEIGKSECCVLFLLYLEAYNNQNQPEISKYKPLIVSTF